MHGAVIDSGRGHGGNATDCRGRRARDRRSACVVERGSAGASPSGLSQAHGDAAARASKRTASASRRSPVRCWFVPGERHHRLMVVLSGQPGDRAFLGMRGEELVTILTPGEFAGEMSTLRGVAGFTRIRVREAGAVIADR